MAGTVSIEQRGNVLVATLVNPPHALMDEAMQRGVLDLARRADTDPTVGAVVLTGAHPTRFIAHFDVEAILAVAKASPSLKPRAVNRALRAVARALKLPGGRAIVSRGPASGLVDMEDNHEVALAIERCSAVWIAALNGDTGGGGCELALACDMRFMADGDFSIGQPEVFLGFPPGAGGTQRLTRLLGRRAALRLCLTGETLNPHEACELGLVDRVVPAGDLLETAVVEGARLGRRPKTAIGAIKRSINIGGSLPLADGLRLEGAEFISAVTTPDSMAAQQAYVDQIHELGDLPIADPAARERLLEEGRFTHRRPRRFSAARRQRAESAT